MKIHKIKISNFGKLKELEIVPDKGITVFYGENEAGKSTLSEFIKYMLYGFSKYSKTEKVKYTPWDSEKISGSLEIEAESGEYSIERQNMTRSVSHIFDADRTDIYDGVSAGEKFFGIDEKTYSKTAFTAQNDITAANMEGVSDSIQNIINSLDEDIDIDEAKKKLSSEKNMLLNKGYKTGKLFELNFRKEELKNALETYLSGHRELLTAEFSLSETQNKIKENRQLLDKINTEYEELLNYRAKRKLSEINDLKYKYEESEKNLKTLSEAVKHGDFMPDEGYNDSLKELAAKYEECVKEKELTEKNFAKVKDSLKNAESGDERIRKLSEEFEGDDALSVSKKLQGEAAAIDGEIKSLKSKMIIFFVLIITIPLALYFLSKYNKKKAELEALYKKYGCSSRLEFDKLIGEEYPSFCDNNKEAAFKRNSLSEKLEAIKVKEKEYCERISNLLSKLDIKADNDILNTVEATIKKIRSDMTSLSEANNERNRQKAEYEAVLKEYDLEKLTERANSFNGNVPQKDEKTLKTELDFYERATKALCEKEKELIKKTGIFSANLPKPGEIESELLLTEREIEESSLKLSAIELAMQLISDSFEDIKRNASPKLTKSAGEMFERVTDGRYKKLYIDPSLSLSFEGANSDITREAFYLSGGTYDLAYITLRIALTEYLFKEKPTLIFDDAFCNFDQKRLENILKLLITLSEQYQIFIFSCTRRECEILNSLKKGGFTAVTL